MVKKDGLDLGDLGILTFFFVNAKVGRGGLFL